MKYICLLAALFLAPFSLAEQSTSSNPPPAPPPSPSTQPAPLQNAPATPPEPEGFSAAPPSIPGSPAGPTFKATTRLVVVDVVVTAKNGAPIHDLKQSDFSVFEGGEEQAIKIFEERKNDSLPVIAPPDSTRLLPAGEATNAGQDLPNAALSVIFFDALDTASSDQSFARDQVKKVIASLPSGSRIAVFVLRSQLHMLQGFTTDATLLANAMNKDKSTISGPWFNDPDSVLASSPGGSASSMSDILSGNATPAGMGPGTYLKSTSARDEAGFNSELRTRKTFLALQAIAKYLSTLPGRKNLFWLAGVFPFDLLPNISGGSVPDSFRGVATYGESLHALAEQMAAGHIAVYPVDVRGLTTDEFNAAGGGTPNMGSIAAISGANLSQHEVMENLAHQTGGRAIYDDNDIKGEIIESLNQGANYYTIAYSPTNHDWNGKYRKIEVRSDIKNANFYYRRGYLAVDPDKPSKAFSSESVPKFSVAMLHGAPERADIVMTVKTSPTGKFIDDKDRPAPALSDRNAPPAPPKDPDLPFNVHIKGTTELYSIECTIDAKTVQFATDKDGKHVPRLALTLLAYDADGKMLNAEIGAFTVPLTDAQLKAVTERGLTINNKMELPLGRVYLRVGVHDLSDDKVGAVELPLVVTRTTQSAAK